jgi:hypothetical protein
MKEFFHKDEKIFWKETPRMKRTPKRDAVSPPPLEHRSSISSGETI